MQESPRIDHGGEEGHPKDRADPGIGHQEPASRVAAHSLGAQIGTPELVIEVCLRTLIPHFVRFCPYDLLDVRFCLTDRQRNRRTLGPRVHFGIYLLL